MSDFNSSLPVRTQSNADIIAAISDATVTSQTLAIDASGRVTTKMQDSAGNTLNSTSNALNVYLTNALPAGTNTIGSVKVTDGTNTLSITAAGEVKVDITQPLPAGSNNIGSVNQGTSPWITSDLADGSATGGTAATKSSLSGGIYNSTLPTLTTGQQASLQLDSSGKLLVNAAVSLGYDENYGTVGATTLRTASQIGNATGAADFNSGATGAQTLRTVANQGAPNTIANAWKMALTDGTNSLSITAAGEIKADITQPLPAGSNTIGSVTQSGGPWTTNQTQVGGSAITLGQKTMANSYPVVISSDQSPIPVTMSNLTGAPVNDFNTASSVAANASSNHDYSITSSKTFNGRYFHASASGKMKIQVQISPDGTTFTTKFVGFNSTANPNIDIQLDMLVLSDTGVGSKIRIIRTNLDNQAQDLYSTICGTEN